MTSHDKYAEWRHKWWKESVAGETAQSRVILPRSTYDRVVDLAQTVEERIPKVLGQIVVSFFNDAESLTEQHDRKQNRGSTNDYAELDKLLRMIAMTTFPDETAASRLRQIAFVNLVTIEHRLGQKPTARSLSKILNAPPSQMDALARSLEGKGVLDRIHTPALTKGKSGRVLYVRKDAIRELNNRHFEITGRTLDG